MLPAPPRGVTTHTITPTTPESVTSRIKQDHARLEALLCAACANVQDGRFEAARDAYEDFAAGLARHIRFEEQVLFPLFEARVGIVGGPTAMLRQEHREIEQAAGLMRAALRRHDAPAFAEACAFLRSLLPPHDAKEEHVLCPTTDQALSDHERAAVLRLLLRD
jgi:hemerythrin-like domain-containing protein